MKIICTKEEYANLIRSCAKYTKEYNCEDCPFASECGEDLLLENAVEFEITD